MKGSRIGIDDLCGREIEWILALWNEKKDTCVIAEQVLGSRRHEHVIAKMIADFVDQKYEDAKE